MEALAVDVKCYDAAFGRLVSGKMKTPKKGLLPTYPTASLVLTIVYMSRVGVI